MRLFESKKAVGKDALAAVIFLFVFGFITIFSYLILTEIIAGFTDAGLYTGQMAVAGNSFLASLRLFDYVIVLIMVALIVGIAVTNFRVASSPVFFIITLITAAFYGFISYYTNFMFAAMVSDAVFANIVLLFPNTLLICTNLHWIAIIMIVIGSIALYGKKPKGQFVE